MPASDNKPPVLEEVAAPAEAPAAEERKFATREDFLAAAGKLAEEEVYVDSIGWLVCSEITGEARADIVGRSATALNKGELDVKSYQKSILLNGLVDPSSPREERRQLFRPGDIDRVMRTGGTKILQVVDVIEKLSAMGRYQDVAEGNSESTPSDDSTSE